ncbi:MAG: hypothetical protein FJX77_11195 [Armatimonadetes bacterium]|nr:hypothetical protein [Armatimonadota bacterium]
MTEGIEFQCPHCRASSRVSQVQGDRCAGCGFEFKWFGPEERRTALDYLEALTRTKHLLTLSPDAGFVIAHE